MTLPTDWQELVRQTQRGMSFKYLYFWGHRGRADGVLNQACLSQWWPTTFTVDGCTYASAEHYMMAEKARLFRDDDALAAIMRATSPAAAKKLGRGVRGFSDAVWNEHRYRIVCEGSAAKFGQNDDLRTFLLGTKKRVLVEASPVDRVWGIGLAIDDPRAARPEAWLGPNLLGFALMAARRDLLEQGR